MSTILPPRNNAFSGSATMRVDGTLAITGVVTDDEIRKLGIKHDGYEKVDAYIPTANGGPWQKVALKFETQVAVGGNAPRDIYDATVKLSPEQQDAVRSGGIAFGIHLNSGEDLWAQKPGDNARVHDER